MAMYDNENTVRKSFDLNYISEYLIQAQWAEMIELKKAITEIADQKNGPISILDIGIGNARVPKHLSGIREVWNNIAVYDGTDNASACVDISNDIIQELGIADKVTAYYFDAADLDKWKKNYDLIITTWFTAGNFYPDDFSFDNYNKNERISLDTNTKFEKIFSSACNLLEQGGEIVLGACYIDSDATRIKQEENYRKMGMTIITDIEDSFTATKEGFWSQRFTREKLYRYLNFADPNKISFTALDTYNFAMQVRIRK